MFREISYFVRGCGGNSMTIGYSVDALVFDFANATISLRPDYNPHLHRVDIQITDDDNMLDGDTPADEVGYDTNQTADVLDMSGNSLASGQVYDEEYFTLQDGGSFHGWVDVLEINGEIIGYIVSEPLEEGVKYALSDAQDVTSSTALEYSQFQDVACFTSGSLISTDQGPIPIECLKPDAAILTKDNGFQKLRWVGSKWISKAELRFTPSYWPVVVSGQSVKQTEPVGSMLVSPLHRVLLTGNWVQGLFGEDEVFAEARYLAKPDFRHAPWGKFQYWHLLLDQHEVIQANGIWCESFFAPDAEGIVDMPGKSTHSCTARRCLKRWEAELWRDLSKADQKPNPLVA